MPPSLLVRCLESAFDIGSRLHLNVIHIHYIYIIFCIVIASFMIYPWSDIDYVDSLLLASGSATQAGLNPIDLNRLQTPQQVILCFVAMVANPVFLHSSMVLVRLYYFHRRFRSLADDAKAKRQLQDNAVSFSHRGQTPRRRLSNYGTMEATNVVPGRSSHENPEMVQRSETSDEIGRIQRMIYDWGGNNNNDNNNNQLSTSSETAMFMSFSPEVLSIPLTRREHAVERRLSTKETLESAIGHLEYLSESDEKDKEGEERPLLSPTDRADNNQYSSGRPQPVNRISLPPESSLAQQITFHEPEHPAHRIRLPGSVPDEQDSSDHHPRDQENHFPSSCHSLPSLSQAPTYSKWDETHKNKFGGIEYRALKTLLLILAGYFVTLHLIGFLWLAAWVHQSPYHESVIQEAGINKYWWAFFTASSAFYNLGYALTPDSMASFSEAPLPLVMMSFLIVVGNTGFPCMLRFIIWVLSKITSWETPLWEELQFLLDHPRRCFTMLFPGADTWRLFFVLVILNAADLAAFFILDWNSDSTTRPPFPHQVFMAGLFQVISTRTAGFSIASVSDFHPAIQVSFIIMMYISAFPAAISMRKTAVYEERSLGIYESPSSFSSSSSSSASSFSSSKDEDQDQDGKPKRLGTLLEEQLGFDLWYIFLGLFLIACVEGDRLQDDASASGFPLFSVLFETVSAYGTVGLSLGYPGTETALCGQFSAWSKLIILAMQVRGRHRGLPCKLDPAVLLPYEWEERGDGDGNGRSRRGSSTSRNTEDKDRDLGSSSAELAIGDREWERLLP